MILKKKVYPKDLKIILNKLEIIKIPIKGLIAYLTLINNNYTTNFIHEGNIKINLPKIPLLKALFNKKKILKKSFTFFLRPNAEPLLRKVIFNLYNQKYINPKKSNLFIISAPKTGSTVLAEILGLHLCMI